MRGNSKFLFGRASFVLQLEFSTSVNYSLPQKMGDIDYSFSSEVFALVWLWCFCPGLPALRG